MTLHEWRHRVAEALSLGGYENALQEAKWFLAAVLARESSFVTLNPTYVPSPSEEKRLQEWLTRRLQGEPLSRIKGTREFWSLLFRINEHTLDPRPETEFVIEGVMRWVAGLTAHPWRILDLGTGSGCILIALLHELKNATGVGVDVSEGALRIARQNGVLNAVDSRGSFRLSNWGEDVRGPFDVIVSNPPYIPLHEKAALEKGVREYDPSQALFGGEDGLDCYRLLAHPIKRLLSPQGIVALEMGEGQRPAVEAIFQEAGFTTLDILKDLAGIERVVVFSGS